MAISLCGAAYPTPVGIGSLSSARRCSPSAWTEVPAPEPLPQTDNQLFRPMCIATGARFGRAIHKSNFSKNQYLSTDKIYLLIKYFNKIILNY
jgi:hypothetical protein